MNGLKAGFPQLDHGVECVGPLLVKQGDAFGIMGGIVGGVFEFGDQSFEVGVLEGGVV